MAYLCLQDTLFPYAREHLGAFLSENLNSEDCSSVISVLRDQASADGVSLPEPDSDPARLREAVSGYVLGLMDADRKVTALKRPQGAIWRA